MKQWNPLVRRFWFQHHQKAGDLARMATRHANVQWAIGGGEEVAAAETCDALIDYLTGFTRDALDADHG